MNLDFTRTLKEYYNSYGVKDEGPSDYINLNDIVSINNDILSDLSILNLILKDNVNKKHFDICNNLIENLANKLSDKALFIEELEQIKDKIDLNIEGISNGIIWFQQVQKTDPRHNENIKITQMDGIDTNIINSLKTQGSLILQLYIALVYMRGGPVYEIIRIGSKNRCKIMNICYKLFNSDYIRHIRNSLSHGTFKTNIAGVYFKDNNYEMVSTPGFLDKLNIWLFVIYYQCLLFIENERG
jgi:hypothetical protein